MSTRFSVGDLAWPLCAEPSLLTLGMLNFHFLAEEGALLSPSTVVEVLGGGDYKIKLPSGKVVEVLGGELSRSKP